MRFRGWMHMKNKETNVVKHGVHPKLRFPDFRDTPGWEEKSLGEMCDVRDGTHDSPAFYYSGKPLITSKNLLSSGLLDLVNVSYISEIDYEKINRRSKVDIGDILFGMIGTIGNPVMIKSDGFAIKNVALIKQKTDIINSYLVHFLNSKYIEMLFNKLNTGNTQKFIALSQIRNLTFPIPSLDEQQRIADCLTSIDVLIIAHSQKLDVLKDHKKALMKQLFPSERKTIPKLRFHEFRDAEDWEKKRIGDKDFATLYKGKGISKSDIVQNGKTPCIRYGELYTIYGEIIVDVVSRTDCTGSDIFLSRKNDVIIPASGETKIDIARASCIKLSNVALGGDLNVIRPNHNGAFISYSLNGPLKREIAKVAQGDSVVHLYPSQLEKMEILVPGEKEQQKIADILTSIDVLIREQSQKLNILKQHKKGLMQQLFPSLSETGNER